MTFTKEGMSKEEEVPLGCTRMLPFYQRAANRLVIFATWDRFNENQRNVKLCYEEVFLNCRDFTLTELFGTEELSRFFRKYENW